MKTPTTPGEVLFKQYLTHHGITDWEFEKEHPNRRRRPDYALCLDDREYLFDVKEFEPKVPLSDVGVYDPYNGVRSKIEEGRRKFKEYKDKACCLVLYNDGCAPLVDLTDPLVMFGAMLGDLGFIEPYNPSACSVNRGSVKLRFLEHGKMRRPQTAQPQNTTISALITLRRILVNRSGGNPEYGLGVIVWENHFARLPFPRSLFCGLYDERYGLDGDYLTRVFAGTGIAER